MIEVTSELSPNVSVIIPFFNRIDLTLRAIRSVKDQDYSNFEIIVVNDGSFESDEPILELMSSIRNSIYIKLNHNVGPSIARNAGIDKSSAEYIAFLDSDDCWDQKKLSVQMKIMLLNGWEFSHTSYYRSDNLKNVRDRILSGRYSYKFPFVVFNCKIATPTVIIKRSVLKNLRFNPDLRVGEDLLFWLELSKRIVLHGIDICLTTVNVGPNTTARNIRLKNKALKSAAVIGLSNHRIYYAIHTCYRAIRRILWF
jgi:glycosyltransferase involved in cell wall biosynthesis